MGVCVFGCGDCGSSAQSSTNIQNDQMNQTLTSILTSNSSNVSTFTTTNQNLTVNMCATANFQCSDFSITQNLTGTFKVITDIDDQTTQNLQTAIKNAIDQNAASSADAKSGFFSTSSSQSVDNTTIVNRLHNIVDTTVSTQNVKAIILNYNFNQTATINLCGTIISKGACTISQTILVSMIADNILSSVNQAVTNDSFMADLQQSGTSSASATTTGPIQELADGINKALKTIGDSLNTETLIIAGVGIAVIIGGVFVFKYFLGAPASAQKKVTSLYSSSNSDKSDDNNSSEKI